MPRNALGIPRPARGEGGLGHGRRPLGVVLAGALCTAAACGNARPNAAGVYADPNAPLEARVESALSLMTLEEKVAQMHGVQVADDKGLSFTPDDARLGIPGFRMVDGMRGVGVRTGVATTFPVGSARGATFDADLERRVGEAIGSEARARGANVLLAPTINLLRHPRWGRAQETYGEDSFHIGVMAAGFVRGAQDHVIASAKHFALNSIEDTRFSVDVQVEERTLREVYLPHFKRAVDAGVGSIMSAYNLVNGAYCGENRHLLSDILDGDWAFDGFVESDWVFGTRSTVPSALAGLDIEMPVAIYYGQPLVDAVGSGSVPMSVVDGAVRRILRAKFRFGIFDGKAPLDPATVVESAEHTALAREAEEKAIVLLKNDRAVLPLDRATPRIAVVGQLANVANIGDTGSSATTSSYVVTPLAGLRQHASPGAIVDLSRDALTADDMAAIAAADVAVVVVGLTSADEGEAILGTGGDRKGLGLSAAHEQLVADVASRNARTIVVLEGSGAILVETFVDQVSALLLAWYPGMEGGNAIAEVLFGDVNPSGKLPVTFPRSEEQLPAFVNDKDAVTYGFLHGYRYVDGMYEDPRYPFGHGLSYTTFAFGNLVLDRSTATSGGRVRVSVDVTNTGARAGDEVVQLYVSYPGSQVERAVRELKGFQRVSLQPGETKAVGMDLEVRDLAYWDAGTSSFVVEPLTYTVSVGDSSRDLPLAASFSVLP